MQELLVKNERLSGFSFRKPAYLCIPYNVGTYHPMKGFIKDYDVLEIFYENGLSKSKSK